MRSAIKGEMGWGMKERGALLFLVGSNIQYPDPPQNILRSELGLNTVKILKRVRESIFSFKAINLEHVRLEIEKG